MINSRTVLLVILLPLLASCDFIADVKADPWRYTGLYTSSAGTSYLLQNILQFNVLGRYVSLLQANDESKQITDTNLAISQLPKEGRVLSSRFVKIDSLTLFYELYNIYVYLQEFIYYLNYFTTPLSLWAVWENPSVLPTQSFFYVLKTGSKFLAFIMGLATASEAVVYAPLVYLYYQLAYS